MNRSNVLIGMLCGLLAAGSVQAAWYCPILRFGQAVKAKVLQHKKLSIGIACLAAAVLSYYGFTKLRDIKIKNAINDAVLNEMPGLAQVAYAMASGTPIDVFLPADQQPKSPGITRIQNNKFKDGLVDVHEIWLHGHTWFKSWVVKLAARVVVDGSGSYPIVRGPERIS